MSAGDGTRYRPGTVGMGPAAGLAMAPAENSNNTVRLNEYTAIAPCESAEKTTTGCVAPAPYWASEACQRPWGAHQLRPERIEPRPCGRCLSAGNGRRARGGCCDVGVITAHFRHLRGGAH